MRSPVKLPSRPYLIVALLVLATWAVTLSFGFVWDDLPTVAANGSLRSVDTLWKAFVADFWGLHDVPARSGYWRPVPTALYAATTLAFGTHPWVFHSLNLLLHAANSILAMLLFARLGLKDPARLLAGLFFALHPIHAETVSFVSAIPDLLAAFFGLWGVLFWTSSGGREARDRWLGMFLMILSLLSKESAVVFPALAFWLTTEKRNTAAVFLPLLLLYGAAHFAVTGGFGDRALWGGSWGAHLATVVKLAPYALFLTFVPVGTSPTREFPVSSGWNDPLAWGALGTILFLAVWLVRIRKEKPGWSAAGLLYLLFWLPVSNLIPAEGLLVDRYLYLPTLGMALFVGLLIGSRTFPPALVAASIVLWGGWGAASSWKWRSDDALWASAVKVSPRSPVAWNERGGTLLRQEKWEESLKAFEEALRLRPGYREASFNVAVVLYRSGDRDGSFRRIEEHLDRLPDDPEGWDFRSTLLTAAGDHETAIESGERAVALAPENWKYRFNLGLTYAQAGRFDGSLGQLEEARTLSRGERAVLLKLGTVCLLASEWKKAREVFLEVTSRWPGETEGRQGLERAERILALTEGK